MSSRDIPMRGIIIPLTHDNAVKLGIVSRIYQKHKELGYVVTSPADTFFDNVIHDLATDIVEIVMPDSETTGQIRIFDSESFPPEGFSEGDIVIMFYDHEIYDIVPNKLGKRISGLGFDIEIKEWTEWG